VSDPGYFTNGLYHTDFIVGKHYAYQDCFFSDLVSQCVNVQQSVTLNGKIRYVVTKCLEVLEGIEHRTMFSRQCYDMSTPGRNGTYNTFCREVDASVAPDVNMISPESDEISDAI